MLYLIYCAINYLIVVRMCSIVLLKSVNARIIVNAISHCLVWSWVGDCLRFSPHRAFLLPQYIYIYILAQIYIYIILGLEPARLTASFSPIKGLLKHPV